MVSRNLGNYTSRSLSDKTKKFDNIFEDDNKMYYKRTKNLKKVYSMNNKKIVKGSAPPIKALESEKKVDIKNKTETHAKVIVSS
jgi:hypothetical protein